MHTSTAVADQIVQTIHERYTKEEYPLLKDGDPILRTICPEVNLTELENGEYTAIVEAMRKLMHSLPAVGLAAPQIGISKRFIVIEDTEEAMIHLSNERRSQLQRRPIDFAAIFNPTIQIVRGETHVYFEGCASYPNQMAAVERPECVILRGYNSFAQRSAMKVTGWFARILCHEVDHLDGISFLDKALPGSVMSLDELKANEILRSASSEDLKKMYVMQ